MPVEITITIQKTTKIDAKEMDKRLNTLLKKHEQLHIKKDKLLGDYQCKLEKIIIDILDNENEQQILYDDNANN
jgi:hypothetical protein